MKATISLAAIAFDAGTQVRASIDEATVSAYAERMTEGDAFPPIVVFHDGNQHYLADGFHRVMAAQRIQWREIDADVRAGTKADAIWFALSANKANGKQMTLADKTHAVELALKQWPEKMQREIAEQIGCSPSLVSKVWQSQDISSNTSGRPEIRGRALRDHVKRERVREQILGGAMSTTIAKELHVTPSIVADVRAEMGLHGTDKSKAAIAQRKQDIRDMAERGFSTRQIAASLSIHEATVGEIAKKEEIVIHADRVVGRTKRLNANRILEQMVLQAESLTGDVDLIDFDAIDRARLPEWLASLKASRDSLGAFIRRLMKEQQNDGEAA